MIFNGATGISQSLFDGLWTRLSATVRLIKTPLKSGGGDPVAQRRKNEKASLKYAIGDTDDNH
jgi:hypothetical protein